MFLNIRWGSRILGMSQAVKLSRVWYPGVFTSLGDLAPKIVDTTAILMTAVALEAIVAAGAGYNSNWAT